uniref:Cytochrome P450, family 2, subfamily K, polypeptide 8 n=1 Tax=Callorhinchus milii TaxID=7868 RepID=A0A4W3IDG5_CALMI
MSLLNLFISDTVTLVLIFLLSVFCVMYFYTRYKTKADLNLPPGPTPLPLIGNLHTLDLKMLYKSLMELSEKYGSVFTIHLGLERVVVLTGYKTVKEALVDQADEFAERAKIAVLEMQANEYGISFGHGESWKQMRRFALTTLRNFGMGKKTIEDKIIEETKFLVQEMESHKGQPFDTAVIVTSAMANIICSIVFGNRFDYKDEIFLTLTELVNENFRLLGSSSIQMYNAFPILGFLPGTHKKIFENRTQMVQLIMNFCKEHQKMLNENDIRSFIDAFLVKQREGTQVIPLLASVLYDKSQWEKPNEFNPSHFLDAEGRFVKKDAFMPFSAGQRICIGESLAKMELFLFFTTLMQTFTFHAPLGALLDLTPCVGLTLCPKPHQVYAVRR